MVWSDVCIYLALLARWRQRDGPAYYRLYTGPEEPRGRRGPGTSLMVTNCNIDCGSE